MVPYTEDQIKKYLEILHNYTKPKKEDENATRKAKCCNCPNRERFSIYSGYKICDKCGVSNGHVLGFFDAKDYDRLHFKKRVFIRGSTTMRKRLIKFLKGSI